MKSTFKQVALAAFCAAAGSAFATPTTIDQDPIVSTVSSTVLPNLMFVLDDSGSMCWQVMPDDAAFGGGVGGAYPSVAGNCQDAGPGIFAANQAKYGPYSSHCNGVYYDPDITYPLPLSSNGTPFAAATVGATRQDGYFASTGINATTAVVSQIATGSGTAALTVPATTGANLTLRVNACPGSVAAPANGVYETAMMFYVPAETPTFLGGHRVFGVYQSCAANNLTIQVTHVEGAGYSSAASNWAVARIPSSYEYLGDTSVVPDTSFTYSAAGTLNTTTTFYTQCNARTNTTPGLFRFTPVTDLQNHANWFSYYRSRINTMKSAMTLAFGGMLNPERYRLGFTTINYSGTDNLNRRYLDIADYCSQTDNCTQRQQFFSKVFQAQASGSTGLRNALSKVGLIFAGKMLTGARDPVQYSCQKNFSLVSTDGYWNTGGSFPNTDYGGYRIPTGACVGNTCYALTNVGNQDGPGQTDRPDYDTGLATTVARPQVDLSRSGGTQPTDNTLSDVSMYYYKTKIRDDSLNNCTSGNTSYNLCTGDVPVSVRGEDRSRWDCNRFQHMNTFTIGLGVEGYLKPFQPGSYMSDLSTHYHGLKGDDGYALVNWPSQALDGSSRTVGNDARTIDDLWHTAVNGRGEYYSAKTPQAIISSLSQALAAIGAQTGTGSGAGGSSQQLRADDSYGYVARYMPETWSGDVLALQFDPATGELLTSAGDPASSCSSSASSGSPVWSAKQRLEAKLAADTDASERKIYMSSGTGLDDFKVANLTPADFDPTVLTQYAGMTAAEQAQATMAHLVDYLRGVRSVTVGAGLSAGLCCEDAGGNRYRLFRYRGDRLGDIVGSTPYFIGKSPFKYGDTGYLNFRDTTTATRQRVLFIGANDGMLHAFDAGQPGDPPTPGSGDELWAFVPTAVLPNMKYLADVNYLGNHKYYVNGPMNVGDVADGSGNWTTLLVGALGAGGRDFYALDVTDPTSPRLMWEFRAKNPTHADNMGYSFGAPVITKRNRDNKWVVLITSGYNNESPGDGKGHLYVVDALTGRVLDDMQTTATASSAESGLSGAANWVDATMTDNRTRYVYAGDLGGRLWRFDIDDVAVDRLAYFSNDDNQVQPIAKRPELGEVTRGATKERWVFVATGKTITEGDLDPVVPDSTALQVQSLYAVKDDLVTTSDSTTFRHVGGVQELNLEAGGSAGRYLSYSPISTSSKGWYFDFDVSDGEKITTDLSLQVGWLVFGTTAPSEAATPCDSNLSGYQYFIEYNPQSTRTSTSDEIFSLGGGLAAGASVFQTSTGKIVVVVTDSRGNVRVIEKPQHGSSDMVRRVSWRELLN